MDKHTDLRIYDTLSDHPSVKNDVLRRRKVLQSRILKLSPDDHLSYGKLGKMLASWGHTQQSIFPLRKAIIISPYKFKTKLVLLDALLKLKKYDEFFSLIKEDISFTCGDQEFHVLLIKTLQKLRRLHEIETIYQEIANMIKNPDSVSFLYFTSAEILTHWNHFAPAIANYKKAFEINTDPLLPDKYYSKYGLVLLREGCLEEALIQFEHVLKIFPNNRLSLNNIAYCHYCLGKVKKALEEYEYIIKNKLQGFGTYSGMILVLLHLGKDEKAIEKYNKQLQTIQCYLEERNSRLEIYKSELKKTEVLLQRSDIDKKTREFNEKKQRGLNKVLALLT